MGTATRANAVVEEKILPGRRVNPLGPATITSPTTFKVRNPRATGIPLKKIAIRLRNIIGSTSHHSINHPFIKHMQSCDFSPSLNKLLPIKTNRELFIYVDSTTLSFEFSSSWNHP